MQEIIQTKDGSHSLKSLQFGESYHSIHGAIQESQTVFIDAALMYKATTKEQLKILEIGFGTGLNALMTLIQLQENKNLKIDYTGVEAYPIEPKTAAQLNYTHQLGLPDLQPTFMAMHRTKNERITLQDHFYFEKRIEKFESLQVAENYYDIIFYDAFAPAAQPDLWKEPMLSKMYLSLQSGGVLTTYCAKGAVKRCLKSIGFELEALAGPIGKREMTRAIKK